MLSKFSLADRERSGLPKSVSSLLICSPWRRGGHGGHHRAHYQLRRKRCSLTVVKILTRKVGAALNDRMDAEEVLYALLPVFLTAHASYGGWLLTPITHGAKSLHYRELIVFRAVAKALTDLACTLVISSSTVRVYLSFGRGVRIRAFVTVTTPPPYGSPEPFCIAVVSTNIAQALGTYVPP